MIQNKHISVPPFVDFMLLGRCNMRCPFCFGPRHHMPPMPTQNILTIIDRLKDLGVTGIVFTGGEPTLISDLPKILSYAKSRGFTCVLSSNGTTFYDDRSFLDDCAKSLDWIALPIDSIDASVDPILRKNMVHESTLHFEKIRSLVTYIKKNMPTLKIKIGTVVTKINQDIVHDIPVYLSHNKAIPDTWKLYQISPSEYGKDRYDDLRVSDELFEKLFLYCTTIAKEHGIHNVQKYTNSDRPGKYLFINPVGELLIIDHESNDYKSVGNIFNNSINNISDHINSIQRSQNITNFIDTYPL